MQSALQIYTVLLHCNNTVIFQTNTDSTIKTVSEHSSIPHQSRQTVSTCTDNSASADIGDKSRPALNIQLWKCVCRKTSATSKHKQRPLPNTRAFAPSRNLYRRHIFIHWLFHYIWRLSNVIHLNSIQFYRSVSQAVHLQQAAEAFRRETRKTSRLLQERLKYFQMYLSICHGEELKCCIETIRVSTECTTCSSRLASGQQESQLKQRYVWLVSSNCNPARVVHCSRLQTGTRLPWAKCVRVRVHVRPFFSGRVTQNVTNISQMNSHSQETGWPALCQVQLLTCFSCSDYLHQWGLLRKKGQLSRTKGSRWFISLLPLQTPCTPPPTHRLPWVCAGDMSRSGLSSRPVCPGVSPAAAAPHCSLLFPPCLLQQRTSARRDSGTHSGQAVQAVCRWQHATWSAADPVTTHVVSLRVCAGSPQWSRSRSMTAGAFVRHRRPHAWQTSACSNQINGRRKPGVSSPTSPMSFV